MNVIMHIFFCYQNNYNDKDFRKYIIIWKKTKTDNNRQEKTTIKQ